MSSLDALRVPHKVHPPDPPAWWPEDAPYKGLAPGYVYRDKDGRWRDHTGVILSRRERRRARLR